MNKIVYIGGLNGSHRVAESTVEAISEAVGGVDDAQVYTFSDTYNDGTVNEIAKKTKEATVITHSAGALALRRVVSSGVQPQESWIFNSPIPKRRGSLLGATLLKTLNMHKPGAGISSLESIKNVMRYDIGSMAEIIRHPIGNMARFINNEISDFDGIAFLNEISQAGMRAHAIATEQDEYYSLSNHQINGAKDSHCSITVVPGFHDELLMRPHQTVESFLALK